MSRRLMVAVVGLLWTGSALAQEIDVDGDCPGTVSVTITGVTPRKSVALVSGKRTGSTALATGSCAGTTVDIRKAKVVFTGRADGTGTLTTTLAGTAVTCGNLLQAVDLVTCDTTPVVSMTPTCDTIDVVWDEAGPTAGPPYMTDPAFFGVETEASVADGIREDFEVEDAAGNIPVPATAIFTFYDTAGAILCDVFYDISDAVLDPTYTATTVTSGTAVSVADGAVATLAGGNSSCGPVDPATWGTQDLRDLIDGDWQFGYNVVSNDLRNEIRAAVGSTAYTADYQPYIIGESISGVEVNFAATYDRTCEVVETDSSTGALFVLPKPGGASVQEHALSFSAYLFGL
jgi:hypothetical protein